MFEKSKVLEMTGRVVSGPYILGDKSAVMTGTKYMSSIYNGIRSISIIMVVLQAFSSPS